MFALTSKLLITVNLMGKAQWNQDLLPKVSERDSVRHAGIKS